MSEWGGPGECSKRVEGAPSPVKIEWLGSSEMRLGRFRRLTRMRFKQILYISLAVRTLQALLTSTFFQPDEFFQALEPAHQLVFGYGHLTWEWRCIRPIRSIVYPVVFVPAYWLVKVLGLEYGQWLVKSFLRLSAVGPMINDYYRYGHQKSHKGSLLPLQTSQFVGLRGKCLGHLE